MAGPDYIPPAGGKQYALRALYFSLKPKLRSKNCESRQFSLTRTQVCKYTFASSSRSMSRRAITPMVRSISPFFPIMMPLWLDFSQ